MITNIINNKVYIGQTRTDISTRWAGHKHDAYRREYHTAIERAIKKYGEKNFTVTEIEKIYADSINELDSKLNELEIYYIKEYHSLTHENGYNITKGGDNISEMQKIKTYCFTIDGILVKIFDSRADAGRFLGIKGEDISCAILRHGLCHGYYFSNYPFFDYKNPYPLTEIKVIQYDLNGNVIAHFNNYKEAAININADFGNLYNVCIGKLRSCKNFIFRFDGDSFDKYPLPVKGCMVNLYKNNLYINTFETIKDCAKNINAFPSNISAVLSNKYKSSKTVKGYNVYYASDPNQPDKSKIIA